MRSTPLSTKMPYRLIADGFMDQCGSNRRINTATQRHDHFSVADLFFQCFNRISNKMCRCPVLCATANIHQKIIQNLFSFFGMIYFRMKLYAIERKQVLSRCRSFAFDFDIFLNAAIGILSVVANNSKPSGISKIVSAWLIHTCDFLSQHLLISTSSFLFAEWHCHILFYYFFPPCRQNVWRLVVHHSKHQAPALFL